MAEERTTTEDPALAEIKVMRGELQTFRDTTERRFDGLTERTARIEGLVEGFKLAFDQMDKRLSSMQWGIGLVVVIQAFILGRLFLK